MPKGHPSAPRTVVCVICGKSFKTWHSQGKYCSEECRTIGFRKSWRKYTEKNRPQIQAYHRRLYASRSVEVCAKTAAYAKTPSGKAAARTAYLNQVDRHPEKIAARSAVLAALRKGTLVKGPCETCGSTLRVHAHHDDYSKPLDVRWMCQRCHRDHHKLTRTHARGEDLEIP